jgi:hypothetical protein
MKQYTELRPRLEPDKLVALWQACASNDIAPLLRLIEILDPVASELTPGIAISIQDSYLDMLRFLLKEGVSFSGEDVRKALKARSFPALKMLREFGWDINANLDNSGVTALRYMFPS